MLGRWIVSLMSLALLAPLLGVAEGPERPACMRAVIAMAQDVDSAYAHSGDSFQFKVVTPTTAPDGKPIPAGTTGFGVVAISQHAERGGRGGYIVIETRFLALPGEHVPVTIDWTTARASATGASRNIPGFVGAIPLVGYVLGPYGFIHHGKDVTIARDTRIPVLIGDDVAMASCRIVAPSPSPSPAPSASPSPSPSSSASPMAPASPGAS